MTIIYSIIIPIFRPTEYLQKLLEEIDCQFTAETIYEIILVDDSDSDASWNFITTLINCPNRKGIRLAKNFGQHCAILAGILFAKGKYIITIDDDGQHDPVELRKLMAAMNDSVDVVYGYALTLSHSRWRNWTSQISKLILSNMTGIYHMRNISAYRIFRTECLKREFMELGSDINIDVMLSWVTNRFQAVGVRHHARTQGQSGYSFFRLLKHMSNLYVGYTTIPLRLVTIAGLTAFTIGGFLMLYVIYVFYTSDNIVPGFAFTAISIMLFSGVQMISLGIIGEYIARIHVATNKKPTFLVKTTYSQQS